MAENENRTRGLPTVRGLKRLLKLSARMTAWRTSSSSDISFSLPVFLGGIVEHFGIVASGDGEMCVYWRYRGRGMLDWGMSPLHDSTDHMDGADGMLKHKFCFLNVHYSTRATTMFARIWVYKPNWTRDLPLMFNKLTNEAKNDRGSLLSNLYGPHSHDWAPLSNGHSVQQTN